MQKWIGIECNKNGTYSIWKRSGERATAPLDDLLRKEISREELKQLIEKAKAKGTISEDCYSRIVTELAIRNVFNGLG